MDKQEFGKQIETLRKECGVSTYELEQKVTKYKRPNLKKVVNYLM